MKAEFILYVANQEKSRLFYSTGLNQQPSLHVAGITEFELNDNVKLGLMPESGIHKILSDKTPHPAEGAGIPRCELYFKYENFHTVYEQFLQAGAKVISEPFPRDWGDTVVYLSDPDGHIIALAQKT